MKTRQQVRELYARRASFYEWFFVDFLGWGKELKTFFQNSNYIYPNDKILDAGCGTGIVTRVLYEAVNERGYSGVVFHAFDIAESMLEIFKQWMETHEVRNIELRRADILGDTFPQHWSNYDLIVSSTMLEYLPRPKVQQALKHLRQLLKDKGVLLVFMTKRNFISRWLAEKWWKLHTFDADEVGRLFREAGFNHILFREFSPQWLNYILVVEARK